ncbi:DUF960 family protein [Macrococcus equi]|uniref:DUF960 family protein n=1 Tax=Macrococcus equi TaxID=3395462 RepID=UPI0039BE2C45
MPKSELYITRGIDENIPKNIIKIIWSLVANREEAAQKYNEVADYLSVFHIRKTNKKHVINIKHLQEQPPYSNTYKVINKESFTRQKVYAIREDSVDLKYFIMLLPEEY